VNPRGGPLRIGALELDWDRHAVRVHGRPVVIAGLQLKLLELLAGRPGVVFGRDQILRNVWDRHADQRDSKTVDVLVCRLRRSLGDAGALVETRRAFGYCLKTNDEGTD